MVKSEVLLGIKQVASMFDISQRAVWRLVAKGELPSPVKVGKLSKWFISDIDSIFEKLKSQRG